MGRGEFQYAHDLNARLKPLKPDVHGNAGARIMQAATHSRIAVEYSRARKVHVEGEPRQQLGAVGAHRRIRPEKEGRELPVVPGLRVHSVEAGQTRQAATRKLKAPKQRRAHDCAVGHQPGRASAACG